MWSEERWAAERLKLEKIRTKERRQVAAGRAQRRADISLAVDLPMVGETVRAFAARKCWALKLGPPELRKAKRRAYMRRYMQLKRQGLTPKR